MNEIASEFSSSFVVHTFQSEIHEILEFVHQNEESESEGDLFGMWTNSGNAVIYIALATEEDYGRTAEISRPDIRRQGSQFNTRRYLQEKYMLCHVGKWHFNRIPRQTGSTEPSESDKRTAIECCLKRSESACILLSVSMNCEKKYALSTHLFVDKGCRQVSGTLNLLPRSSQGNGSKKYVINPFRNVPGVRDLKMTRQRGVVDSNSWIISNLNGYEKPHERSRPSVHPTTAAPHANQAQFMNSSSRSPESDLIGLRESTFKKVQEKLCSMTEVSGRVVAEHKPSTEYTLKFQMNQKIGKIDFPKDFPKEPVRMFIDLLPENSYVVEITPKNQRGKLNSVSCILSALESCRILSSRVSPSTSTAAVSTTPISSNRFPGNISMNEFAREVCDSLKQNFETVGDINLEEKREKDSKKVELTFVHNLKKWLTVIPVEYPDKFIRIYNVYGNKNYELRYTAGQRIDDIPKIVKYIKQECSCVNCFRRR